MIQVFPEGKSWPTTVAGPLSRLFASVLNQQEKPPYLGRLSWRLSQFGIDLQLLIENECKSISGNDCQPHL
jgi:hypothetical protein